MSTPAEPINLPLVDQATLTVTADVACIKCEYNLRTLKLDGVCPECGRSVRDSLRPEALWLADPSWLGRLRAGFALMAWGMVGVCILAPLVSVVVASQWWHPMHTRADDGATALVTLAAVLCLAIVVVLPVGFDRILAPEPGDMPSRHRWMGRVRSCLSAGLWLVFPLPLGIAVCVDVAGYSPWVTALMFALTIDASCLGSGVYFRWLAARACDLRIVRCTTWIIWLTGISGGITLFLLLTRLWIETLESTAAESGGLFATLRWTDGCGRQVCGASHVAALMCWTALMVFYSRLLNRVVREAEKARGMASPL